MSIGPSAGEIVALYNDNLRLLKPALALVGSTYQIIMLILIKLENIIKIKFNFKLDYFINKIFMNFRKLSKFKIESNLYCDLFFVLISEDCIIYLLKLIVVVFKHYLNNSNLDINDLYESIVILWYFHSSQRFRVFEK